MRPLIRTLVVFWPKPKHQMAAYWCLKWAEHQRTLNGPTVSPTLCRFRNSAKLLCVLCHVLDYALPPKSGCKATLNLIRGDDVCCGLMTGRGRILKLIINKPVYYLRVRLWDSYLMDAGHSQASLLRVITHLVQVMIVEQWAHSKIKGLPDKGAFARIGW